MKLSELKINEEYFIDNIDDSDMTHLLYEMGILPGCKIILLKKSKMFNSLYQIEGTLITLDINLIKLINVKNVI